MATVQAIASFFTPLKRLIYEYIHYQPESASGACKTSTALPER
nr:hypothetical protein [Chroococcidiopsis sp. TS-821]